MLVGIIIGGISIIFTWACTAPQFGGNVSVKQKEVYSESPNFRDDRFINESGEDYAVSFSLKEMVEGFREMRRSTVVTTPPRDIPTQRMDPIELSAFGDSTRLFWFGHSSFLLQIENKNILIDPVFSKVPSPISWIGEERFSKTLPISIEELPEIDFVLISHDHYDHLDYESIKQLKDKVKEFYMPLGVGVHFKRWGIEDNRIHELDWWGETQYDNIALACTPAQHRSGRRPNNSNSTLWSSWVISTEHKKLYYSGDSGYASHFKAIGEKYGPFDLALLECGQYNNMWPYTHMFPEQTAQAGVDLQAESIMPIHWGAFTISQHTWSDPVERVMIAAQKLDLPVIAPKIGEPILLYDSIIYSNEEWWVAINDVASKD